MTLALTQIIYSTLFDTHLLSSAYVNKPKDRLDVILTPRGTEPAIILFCLSSAAK